MDRLNLRGLTTNNISVNLTLPSTSVHSTTVTSQCVINGKFGTAVTAITTGTTPVTDANTGAAFRALGVNKATVLVFGFPLAGGTVMAMCQGSIEDTDVGVTTTVGGFRKSPQWPALPDDFCPVAYALVRTAPDAASWIPGTGAWDASGVTTSTVQNVFVLPVRPVAA